jgi:hypothetical protein
LSWSVVGSAIRKEARWLAIEIAAKRDDAIEVEVACALAIAEGDLREPIRWARVTALERLRRPADALAEALTDPPLAPPNESRAILLLRVFAQLPRPPLDQIVAILDAFADAHDVHAMGLSIFLGARDGDAFDAEVVAAMNRHLGRYTTMYPESSFLRKANLDFSDVDALREQMRSIIVPDSDRDREVRQLAERVAVGELPLGLVAALLDRPYLDLAVQGTAIGFPSIPVALDELDQEIRMATAHLDTAVVVDLSSLVSTSLVPELWPNALASFSSVSIPESLLSEIDRQSQRKSTWGWFGWDHNNDRLTVTEVGAEQASAITSQIAAIRSVANELRAVPSESLAALPALAGETIDDELFSLPWTAALATAGTRSAALLCDDVAVSRLARSIGIPAFGSFALAVALARSGRLMTASLEDIVRSLLVSQADDLPLGPGQMAAMLQSAGWPMAPSIHPMTRPQYWQDFPAACLAFVTTIEGLGSSIDPAAHALYGACMGLTRTSDPTTTLISLGALFALAVTKTQADPQGVSTLIAATRSGALARELADPFDYCVRALTDLCDKYSDKDKTSAIVLSSLSDCSPQDRSRATTILLGDASTL